MEVTSKIIVMNIEMSVIIKFIVINLVRGVVTEKCVCDSTWDPTWNITL